MRDLFTVGPVNRFERTLKVASQPIPYFRNQEFSEVMFEIRRDFLDFLNAPQGSKAVVLTSSGTGGMEAAIISLCRKEDTVLVINGGTFGARFLDICNRHGIRSVSCDVPFEADLTAQMLAQYENIHIDAICVNIHETSVGKLYDGKLLGDFAKRKGALLIVDAISSFLADENDMSAIGADVVIVSSQKALALDAGLCLLALSTRAQARIVEIACKDLYFGLDKYLADAERGQTPFTPAVGTVLTLQDRLAGIRETGIGAEINRCRELAAYFRANISHLPLTVPRYALSDCLTPILFANGEARAMNEFLVKNYDIHITPSGGVNADCMARIGHIGNHDKKGLDRLISAMEEFYKR